MLKINSVIIAIVVVAILGLLYFVVKRNRKDQKNLERELNATDIDPHKHHDEQI